MKHFGFKFKLAPKGKSWGLIKDGKNIEICEPIEFMEYCNNGFIFMKRAKYYKTQEFVREIAQQYGSSHESAKINEDLNFELDRNSKGIPIMVYMLFPIGRIVYHSGAVFLNGLKKRGWYNPVYDWSDIHLKNTKQF